MYSLTSWCILDNIVWDLQREANNCLLVSFSGIGRIDAIIKEVVIVSISLPPMTIDDFFGPNVVSNIAAFLGVPANKIRIVDIVRETGNRRRRAEGGTTLNIEIGEPWNC